MMGDRARAPRVRTQRRRSVWVNKRVNLESLAIGQNLQTIDGNRNVDNADGLTVVRTIVDLQWGSDTSGGRGRIGFGVTLMNADASAAGAAPEVDAGPEEADWILLVPELMYMWSTGAPERGRATYDVKSKRKYDQGDILVLVIQSYDATNEIDVSGYVRSLILLP